MKIIFVSIFEDLIRPYFDDSILGRARKKGLFEIEFINPRDYASNSYKRIDDKKISGGAGMLMACEPFFKMFRDLKKKSKAKIIFLLPAGKTFTQKDAVRLAREKELILVSSRYEGIDERVVETFADEVLSIGDYVLTGGELPSLVLSDAILRNVKGVLGNACSLEEESFNNELLEAPSFTKPPIFEKKQAISELLKGNHSKIRTLNTKLARLKTLYFKARKPYEK